MPLTARLDALRPIGKPGKRYESASRWSIGLTKLKEIRHILRENEDRYQERKAIERKKLDLIKELRQWDVCPLPMKKEVRKVLDHEKEYKMKFITPKTVRLTESDVQHVYPESLNHLRDRLREMKASIRSHGAIAQVLREEYTRPSKCTRELKARRALVLQVIRDELNNE